MGFTLPGGIQASIDRSPRSFNFGDGSSGASTPPAPPAYANALSSAAGVPPMFPSAPPSAGASIAPDPQFGNMAYGVTNVGAPPTPAAYGDALSQSFAPYFKQSGDELAGRLASMGILDSGAGSQQFQDLTARNNSTYANALLPLIQQGFGQQFAANEANAGAANQSAARGFDAAFQAQQAALGRDQSAQEFNANLQQNQNQFQSTQDQQLNEYNTGIANQYQLAQMGYGNSDYQQQLNQLSGIYGSGLGGLSYILGQGQRDQYGAMTSAGQYAPYAQSIGAAGGVPSSFSSPYETVGANGQALYGGQPAGGADGIGGYQIPNLPPIPTTYDPLIYQGSSGNYGSDSLGTSPDGIVP